LLVGLLWAAAIGVVGVLTPSVGECIVSSPALRITIAVGGVLAGLLIALVGWFTHTRAHSWMALGCMVIALAHVEKLTLGVADADPDWRSR
jgi:hypothetical protein